MDAIVGRLIAIDGRRSTGRVMRWIVGALCYFVGYVSWRRGWHYDDDNRNDRVVT